MWSPFSRKSRHGSLHQIRRRTEVPEVLHEETAWDPARNPIATIDRIGPTAVATLTVTALSTKQGVAMLMNLFNQVSHTGAKALVLDIQNLEFMDSVCLGCMVKALNCAVQDGGKIALVNAEGNVQDLFRITRLDRLFPICHNVPAALATVERR